MNDYHLEVLASPRWREMLERDLLPWVESVADLGDDVLEIGPGPGLTTDLLRTRAEQVTAIEIDPALASKLAKRLAGSNVTVINGSAVNTGLADGRFTATACFAILHHVESPDLQDLILHEALRVLRPGGVLVGSDGYDDERTRLGHVDDVFVPLDPDLLPSRLARIGFTDTAISRGDYDFRFCARKPG
jgi:SAM-dependent methyltransferase